MQTILITDPIYLSLDLLDKDENLPSFKMAITAKLDMIRGDYSLENRVWFTCSDWKIFTKQLHQLEQNDQSSAALESMSNNFKLIVNKTNQEFTLTVNFENYENDKTKFTIVFSQQIEPEAFSSFVYKISEVEKTW